MKRSEESGGSGRKSGNGQARRVIPSREIAEALAPSVANRDMRESACTNAEAMHDPAASHRIAVHVPLGEGLSGRGGRLIE